MRCPCFQWLPLLRPYAQEGHEEILQLLLDAGAEKDQSNGDDERLG